MSKVAVVYWSGTGNTQQMAEAVQSGAANAGADADLFEVSETTADAIAAYDGVALGCPSMGAEQLEEDSFQPFWDDVKAKLAGKKVALFGSWGWGGGEWMETWKADAEGAGITLASDPVICQEAPDDDALDQCKALGAAIA